MAKPPTFGKLLKAIFLCRFFVLIVCLFALYFLRFAKFDATPALLDFLPPPPPHTHTHNPKIPNRSHASGRIGTSSVLYILSFLWPLRTLQLATGILQTYHCWQISDPTAGLSFYMVYMVTQSGWAHVRCRRSGWRTDSRWPSGRSCSKRAARRSGC